MTSSLCLLLPFLGWLTSVLLQCGCCWSFASVAVAECLNNMANKNVTSLSEQQLIDCDHKPPYVDGGCEVSCLLKCCWLKM